MRSTACATPPSSRHRECLQWHLVPPAYRIEKRPALARRQGAWAVIGQGDVILKRGHELAQVLKIFDKGRFAVVE